MSILKHSSASPEGQIREKLLRLSDAMLFEAACGESVTENWRQIGETLKAWRLAYMQTHSASEDIINREFVEEILPKIERLAISCQTLLAIKK
jgi:hypothetical protein